jgi:peptidoglycan/xylan/chitin deacetylase (PgdA/CDA1 family)
MRWRFVLGLLGWLAPFAALSLIAASAAQAADSAVILMYHRFGENDVPSTNIRIEQFEAHLKELKEGGFIVLPLPEIIDKLKRKEPLPEKAVAISVDDAYLSVYREAWPRLKKLGWSFTFFITTEDVDRGGKRTLSWAQIKEMADQGVTIGHHSKSHPHMGGEDGPTNQAEIDEASKRFEEMLGKKPELFAYPYGEASLAVKEQVKAAGFKAAFGQHSGVSHVDEDMFYLPRFPLNETYGEITRFRQIINALPLKISGFSPNDPRLAPDQPNPPVVRFRLSEEAGAVEKLICYTTHSSPISLSYEGRNVSATIAKPFPKGRGRISCTLPVGAGRYRWYGFQYYLPGAEENKKPGKR